MSRQLPTEWFLRDTTGNAAVSWLLTGVLVLTAVDSILAFVLFEAMLATVAAVVAIVPPSLARSWRRTLPWPFLLLASIPVVLRTVQPSFFGLVVGGVGIAALGMLVVVTLQLTTPVRMTPAFAIGSVVLATLSFAGFWAVGSAAAATYLGATFLETNDELMRVFTAAAIGGLVGGGLFRWFFRRQLKRDLDGAAVRVEVSR